MEKYDCKIAGDSALNNSCAKKFFINALDTYLNVISYSSLCEMIRQLESNWQCQSHNEGSYDVVFPFVSSLNLLFPNDPSLT